MNGSNKMSNILRNQYIEVGDSINMQVRTLNKTLKALFIIQENLQFKFYFFQDSTVDIEADAKPETRL